MFAAVQLPFGVLLDRYGPRTIQSALLLLASAGALVFALADGLLGLVIGRALLGLGVALALMAGFKAIVLWFPPDRLALANGWLVMLGALGAVTATAPAELVVLAIGWRGLFAVLAGLSALAALLVLFAVPEPSRSSPRTRRRAQPISLWAIYRDPTLLAHCTALGSRHRHILVAAGPVGRAVAARRRRPRSRRRRPAPERDGGRGLRQRTASGHGRGSASSSRPQDRARAGIAPWALSMAAQVALVFGWPIPSLLLWAVIAAAGAATVLSFAILAEYFPKEMSGRANAALNLLHVGAAFVLQSATGLIIEQWPEARGTYPAEAHQTGHGRQLLSCSWSRSPGSPCHHDACRYQRWRVPQVDP